MIVVVLLGDVGGSLSDVRAGGVFVLQAVGMDMCGGTVPLPHQVS